jgi:hypothetical protein
VATRPPTNASSDYQVPDALIGLCRSILVTVLFGRAGALCDDAGARTADPTAARDHLPGQALSQFL